MAQRSSTTSPPRRLLLLLLLLLLLALPSHAQVIDNIDWPSFLTRSDPIWSFSTNVTCTKGYTVLPSTIKHEPAPNCEGVPCASAATCVEESASQCDACASCSSFGLCPVWHNGTTPQLFGNSTPFIPNPQWTTYVKGGPALTNHTSCSRTGTPQAVAWEDSAFFGNGLSGGLLRVEEGTSNTLRVDLGRTDVWDRRSPGSRYAVGNTMFDRPRLPVGYLHIVTRGNITAGTWRVHLHNATVSGSVTTTEGTVSFLLLAHYTRIALLLAWSATGGEAPAPADGTGGVDLVFVPMTGNSTRQNPPPTYLYNPVPVCTGPSSGWAPLGAGPLVCTQDLLAGSSYATALLTTPLPASASPSFGYITAIHIANDFPASSSNVTAAEVVGNTTADAVADLSALLAEHAAWWAAYWPTSFLSLPDTSLEGTWLMQMYKLASSTRPGGPALDLMGPWWQKSGWELFWLDMNVQVQNWPTYAAAKFDIGRTLVGWLLQNTSQLFANPTWPASSPQWTDAAGISGSASYDAISTFVVEPGQQLGNFPWLLHNLYMQATYTGDAAFLADSLFPILRASVNLYRHFSVADQGDGLIHLPPTASPEYPYPHGPTNDTNYDLALFLWGAKTLLDLANATGNGADPLVPYWRSVVATLTPSPADPVHGLNVSLGVGFDIPHRHFSHLFSIYPLHILPFSDKDGGTPATQGLIARSLDRWSGLTCGGGGGGGWACPNGFTYVGVASMSALMGADGDDSRRAAAVGNLSSFVRSGLMHASTLYSEGHQPCIESPLGFASSLMEVLLQSWGGRVRVFPAVPAAWADAVIHNMGAEGGFRVSAARAGGTTQWVGVRAVNYTSSSSSSSSSAAAPGSSTRTIVLATDMVGPFATSPAGVPVTILPSGDITFPVPVGPDNEADASWVVVFPASGGAPLPFTVQPLAGNSSQYNYWGMH